ncbi:MAG TPA: hypothetical protein VK797_23380 [Tepidisphaeraceae bacterium]|jgi:hypothetical protein|nr:hypothetical protein [Tepidisphaeraceae bacterium]
MASAATVSEPALEVEEVTIRDVRTDDLGFVNELWTHFDQTIKPLVKGNLTHKGARRGAGEFFDCILAGGGAREEVDPAKFLKLYEGKKISREEFLSALKVALKPLGKFLSQKQIDAISRSAGIVQPSLTVNRIKGVEFTLVDAVKAIARAVE